jgi:prepilin-type processing-associated H-X9-DG protein
MGHSAFVFILPYIEGNANYNAFNITRRTNYIGNDTATSTIVSAYICPSDTKATPPDPTYFAAEAQGSYATSRGRQENIGYNWALAAYPDPNAPYYSTCNYGGGDGMFGPENSVKIGDVTDGLSNTFFFGEMSRFRNEPPGSPFNFAFSGSQYPGPVWSTSWPAQPPFPTYWPNDWRVTSGAYVIPKLNTPADTTGNIYNACFATAAQPPDWINVPACLQLGQYAFRSNHPGGANFVMADGSVRFIKDTIATTVYRGLGTRALGEVISADQY